MDDKNPNPTNEQRFVSHDTDSLIHGILQRNSDRKIPVAEKEPEVVQPSAKPTDVKEPAVSSVVKEPATAQAEAQDQPDPVQLVSEDDLLLLADKGLTDSDLEGKTVEEVAELVKTHKTPEQPTTEQQQPSPVVTVTQEMADKIGGIAKSFVGKSAEDLLVAMQNQQAYISKLEAEKTKQPELTTKEQNAIAKEMGEIDLLDADPEEQTKKIADIVSKVTDGKSKKDIEAIVQKVIRETIPNIEEIKRVATERTTDQFLKEIESGLPEGYKASDEIVHFKADKNLSQEEVKFYMQYPERLIKDVQEYAQAKDLRKKYNDVLKAKDREIKLKSFERFRSAMLRTADSPKNATDVNIAPRVNPKDGSDWTIQKIRERHQK